MLLTLRDARIVRVVGNPGTFRSRLLVEDLATNEEFIVSLNDVDVAQLAGDAKAWFDGYVSGSEPLTDDIMRRDLTNSEFDEHYLDEVSLFRRTRSWSDILERCRTCGKVQHQASDSEVCEFCGESDFEQVSDSSDR